MTDAKKYEEWFYQSDYDLETAVDMFKSERYVYCIFMCHLSLEKALKGLLVKQTGEYPPKSHSLIFFVEKLGLQISDSTYEFIFTLNKISVPTRYPEDLRKLFEEYTKSKTEDILNSTRETQSWMKQQ
jgi:HEPN domain-containing protein